MPAVQVILFRETDGSVPIADWLQGLPTKERARCVERIELLRMLGHELRRPEADYLRDDIYELRIRFRRLNYRILYFFHGRTAVVLSHGLVKEREVPPKEIDRAVQRRLQFIFNPQRHAALQEL